jgi:hypothetical protein
MKFSNGVLLLSDYDCTNIRSWMDDDGLTPVEAIEAEVALAAIDIISVGKLQLSSNSKKNFAFVSYINHKLEQERFGEDAI